MMKRNVVGVLLAGMLIVFGMIPRAGLAQQGDSACPALVELALSQLGNNCSNLSRNSACYGYNKVDATFAEGVNGDLFARPADRAELATLETVRTAPLDLGLGQWGIAILNVQANVPDTLPGQAVTFLLLGDTAVENAVDTSGVAEPVAVITQDATSLFTEPDTASEVQAQIPSGSVLQATQLSRNSLFIWVLNGDTPGWISRKSVNDNSAIDGLPVSSEPAPAAPSPMQSFYFRTSPAGTTCNQTPSVLAIQSPENIKVDLTANGADIQLGSLITLEIIDAGGAMRLTTIHGEAVLNLGQPDEIHVPGGFTTTHCLDAADNLGQDGAANDQEIGDDCDWDEPSPVPVDEQDVGQVVQSVLERVNQPTVTLTSTPETTECPNGTTIVHTVATGENLFRVGLRYQTSIGAIMQANNITNAQVIYVGQQLVIPCGVETDIPSVPPNDTPQFPDQIPVGLVDCNPFRATSPLDGFVFGANTFFWDGAPGATSYRVNIFNVGEKGGALVASFSTDGTKTSLTADITDNTVGFGFAFAWEVQAFLNGQLACTTQRFNVPRSPAKSCPLSGPCP